MLRGNRVAVALWAIAGALTIKALVAIVALTVCLGPYSAQRRDRACARLLPALGRMQVQALELVLRTVLQCARDHGGVSGGAGGSGGAPAEQAAPDDVR